ncbi:thioredoxin domain-containing protein [Desulfoprunum benzoelyticum]|nr:thioredoxin domain-containing protein [Desulfoprunum benzoelyticum]
MEWQSIDHNQSQISITPASTGMNPVIHQGTGKTLPYRYYAIPVFILLLLGLADTGYLIYSHYRNYTDISFSSFCALTKAINCDTVSQSPWSILLGLPLAIWGLFSYLLYLIIFLAASRRTKGSESLWHLLFLLGLLYSIASIYLGYVSATKVKAYCLLCLASYGISFSLCYYAWIIRRRFCADSFWRGVKQGTNYLLNSWTLTGSILCLVATLFFLKANLPRYWEYTLPPPSKTAAQGLTAEGNPWIGAEDGEITIHEYMDYLCFQCRKMHLFLRRLIAEHPGKIKLIHHHYPMDHEFNPIVVPEPFHAGAGKMAMIAIYAASKGKFWEMNDELYTIAQGKESFDTRTLGEKTDFTAGELAAASQHPQIREVLLYDIRQGMKLGITGTPSYVIDGKVYEGSMPGEILQKIMK